jgi:hypothetical protein
MRTKHPPRIIFLIPVEELSDESLATLHEALDQVPRVMELFAHYNSEVQSIATTRIPIPKNAGTIQLHLDYCPICAGEESGKTHDN